MLSQPGSFLLSSTMKQAFALLLAVAASTLAAGEANAAPAQASGSAQANVILPGSVVQLATLRFGQFIRPTTAGTLSIDHTGTVTSTGGVTAGISVAQTGFGRGPGSFELTGSPNRQCDITLPASITLSNGAQTMSVNGFSFNANVNGGGKIKLDATGHAQLNIGATLNVSANQALGAYTGSYNITVAFQ